MKPSHQNARTINSASDASARVPVPKEVREERTEFTSVYEQGKLIYDGARAREGDVNAPPMPGSGSTPSCLNEFLKWGISNSNPDELKKMAESGKSPTLMDREIMDYLLGEPIVAKMRACLGKLPQSAGAEPPEGVDSALSAMEELEYYVEDIDNAVDMAKIGGLQLLVPTICDECTALELRAAACGVLATSLQNNPKVQEACLTHDVLDSVFAVLRSGLGKDELVSLQRQSLLAVSALVRSSAAAIAQLLTQPDSLEVLLELTLSKDMKLRRRSLFLLLSLVRDSADLGKRLVRVAATGSTLLELACDEDDDTREHALHLFRELHEQEGASDLRNALLQLDAHSKLSVVASNPRMVGEVDGNPEHAEHLAVILSWLKST